MERLAWVVAALLSVALARRYFRNRPRRRVPVAVLPATTGRVNLIVVVSSRCAVCPAQKYVVERLCERYPMLPVVAVDAEKQPEKVRTLAVMTVPTTLVLNEADAPVYVNHGLTQLDVLVTQVEHLLPSRPESAAP